LVIYFHIVFMWPLIEHVLPCGNLRIVDRTFQFQIIIPQAYDYSLSFSPNSDLFVLDLCGGIRKHPV